jgi:hypothetical protein
LNFWGYNIDTPLEWAAVAVLLALCLGLYFSLIWFIQKFTTGILGGFILMLAGLALVMGPAYYLISNTAPIPQMVLSVAAIFAGCITILIGAFSLTDFRDF